MAASIRLRLRRFWSDQRGLSIVEFGAIAPFLGLLIVGVADLGRGYTARFALQQAANRTLEYAHLGTRSNDYSFLTAHAQEAAGPTATVTLTQWLECDGGSAQPFNGTCSAGQQTARYVTLQIVKPFDPLFTTAGYPTVSANGTVPLQARASLRVQ